VKDKQELARYSFKMASDEQGEIMDLHRRIRELEDDKQTLLSLVEVKQHRAHRLSRFQHQLGDDLLCPECWGNWSMLEKLTLSENGLYGCQKCKFVFASQVEK
jgi:hypothetical protein